MDDDGYVRIVGRIKDMIIRGGENVYPREVEEFLHTIPGVAEAQVIGVPCEKYGEEVMAWVRLRAGRDADRGRPAGRLHGRIATFKIPRYWKFVDAFPMTVTGKVQKFRMREMAGGFVVRSRLVQLTRAFHHRATENTEKANVENGVTSEAGNSGNGNSSVGTSYSRRSLMVFSVLGCSFLVFSVTLWLVLLAKCELTSGGAEPGAKPCNSACFRSVTAASGDRPLSPAGSLRRAADLGFEAVMLAGKRPHLSPLDMNEDATPGRFRTSFDRATVQCPIIAAYTDLTSHSAAESHSWKSKSPMWNRCAGSARALGASIVRFSRRIPPAAFPHMPPGSGGRRYSARCACTAADHFG